MVFDAAFTAACHEDDFFDTGGDSFFHDILQGRFIDERQHLFWDYFAGW